MFLFGNFLTILLVAILSHCNDDTIIYISSSGTNEDTCGTEDLPCQTVSYGYSRLAPNTDQNSLILEVMKESICEEQEVTRINSPITLQGADRSVIIRGDPTVPQFLNVFTVNDRATFSLLTAQRHQTCSFALIQNSGRADFSQVSFQFYSGSATLNAELAAILIVSEGRFSISDSDLKESPTGQQLTFLAVSEGDVTVDNMDTTKAGLTDTHDATFLKVFKGSLTITSQQFPPMKSSTNIINVGMAGKLVIDEASFEISSPTEAAIIFVDGGEVELTAVSLKGYQRQKVTGLVEMTNGKLSANYLTIGSFIDDLVLESMALFTNRGGRMVIQNSLFSHIQRTNGRGGIIDSTGGTGEVILNNNVFDQCISVEDNIAFIERPDEEPFTNTNLQLTTLQIMEEPPVGTTITLKGSMFNIPVEAGNLDGTIPKQADLTKESVARFVGITDGMIIPLAYYKYPHQEGDVEVGPEGINLEECGEHLLPCQTFQFAYRKLKSGDTLRVVGDLGVEINTFTILEDAVTSIVGLADDHPTFSVVCRTKIDVANNADLTVSDLAIVTRSGSSTELFVVKHSKLTIDSVDLTTSQFMQRTTFVTLIDGDVVISGLTVKGTCEGYSAALVHQKGGRLDVSYLDLTTPTKSPNTNKFTVFLHEGGTISVTDSFFLDHQGPSNTGGILESTAEAGKVVMNNNVFEKCTGKLGAIAAITRKAANPFTADMVEMKNIRVIETSPIANSIFLDGENFEAPVKAGRFEGTLASYDKLTAPNIKFAVGSVNTDEYVPLVYFIHPHTDGPITAGILGLDVPPCGREKLPCATVSYAILKQGADVKSIIVNTMDLTFVKTDVTLSAEFVEISSDNPARDSLWCNASLTLSRKTKMDSNSNVVIGRANFHQLAFYFERPLDTPHVSIEGYSTSFFGCKFESPPIAPRILKCTTCDVKMTQCVFQVSPTHTQPQFTFDDMSSISFSHLDINTPSMNWMSIGSCSGTFSFVDSLLQQKPLFEKPTGTQICYFQSGVINVGAVKTELKNLTIRSPGNAAFLFKGATVTASDIEILDGSLGIENFPAIGRSFGCYNGSLDLANIKKEEKPIDTTNLWMLAIDDCKVTLDGVEPQGTMFVPQPTNWTLTQTKATKKSEATWNLTAVGSNLYPCAMLVKVSGQNKSENVSSILSNREFTYLNPNPTTYSVIAPMSLVPFPPSKTWTASIVFSGAYKQSTEPLGVAFKKPAGAGVAVAIVLPIVLVLVLGCAAFVVIMVLWRRKKRDGYTKLQESEAINTSKDGIEPPGYGSA
ncbi:hypothetical protein BLNAU_11444 [Blattamonas nauphoetae]|uniref:Uncharacterized protein n=1 Tax=Blattamonas nauphoetae TaxID=2049346 RepID=A0ABQ9XQS1_9EUKA|nr:hypothetical protein BLNAU_11444 [Blattamonas nauphoetae]